MFFLTVFLNVKFIARILTPSMETKPWAPTSYLVPRPPRGPILHPQDASLVHASHSSASLRGQSKWRWLSDQGPVQLSPSRCECWEVSLRPAGSKLNSEPCGKVLCKLPGASRWEGRPGGSQPGGDLGACIEPPFWVCSAGLW